MDRSGNLLIAHPKLSPTNPFYKTVIYLFHDDAEGSKGLIINKPSKYPVSDFIINKGYDMYMTRENMRYGGPVATQTVIMLHTDEWTSSSTDYFNKGVGISCDEFMIEKIATNNQPNLWRMMVGMCAWHPGQLDLELKGKYPYKAENSWLTAEANTSILFEQDGDKQWDKALALSSKQMIAAFF